VTAGDIARSCPKEASAERVFCAEITQLNNC
jgi:hypothetical protein